MPTYEYRCDLCGHEMEAIQRISADALTTCPQCEGEGLKRLISRTSFMLKGGGWYATDYAGKKTHDNAASAPTAPAPSPPTGGDSTKSSSSD